MIIKEDVCNSCGADDIRFKIAENRCPYCNSLKKYIEYCTCSICEIKNCSDCRMNQHLID